MSIRVRLLLGVLALTAVGLAVTALVSHVALRSYLSDRLNQQVESAEEPVGRSLFGSLIQSGKAPGNLGDAEKPRLPRRPPQVAEPGLPPGTYGEIRDRGGKVIARKSFSYGERDLAEVNLPAHIPLSRSEQTAIITAGATHGSDRFRVAAFPLPRGGASVVVALPEREMNQTLSRLGTIELIVSAAVLAGVALLTLLVVRLGLAPLERMQRAARAIAGGSLEKRVEPASERTEVGRLGIALNEMLRRIQDAFAKRRASEERMRQFLADASHELRTPLSSIRGYAELFRLGMADDPDELAKALRRIEDDSKRMGDLVEDLLTLARLDQVRERSREAVDLVSIARQLCEEARGLAPERRIVLHAARSATVVGDADQLRRAIRNLLANAVQHTPSRTLIAVSLEHRGEQVRIAVRDRGPGLPPGAESAVFERFWRGDLSRGRGDGGSGLGLAIVSAIVAAHGGNCFASVPTGGGARFVIDLPARAEPGRRERASSDPQPILRRV